MRKVYKSFEIAGIEYYEALFAVEEMKVGDELILKREYDNIYDENAVEIYYKDIKLGYIPKSANYSIARIMDAGWDIFEAYIQALDKNNLKIKVAVFLEER
ncbi:MAG: HIRAN domain-containing protein [Nautiliaceae bacterium]